MQMMSDPLWITSPAAVDINFGTLALKMKTGHLKKGGNLTSMKTVLQYENITGNNLTIFAENNFSGAKRAQ
jgi:hypothetical protein